MNDTTITPPRRSRVLGSIRQLLALLGWIVTSWVRSAGSEARWQQR